MKIQILHRPAHSLAQIRLERDESIVAEAGAMVGMTPNVQIETKSGGLVAGLKRVLGGESFFRNTFTSHGGKGELLLGHGLPGDLCVLDVPRDGLVVAAGSFVASSADVSVETKVGGLKSMLAGEGMFLLEARRAVTVTEPVTATATEPATATATVTATVTASVTATAHMLMLGAFGGIEELACDGALVVDTGHLVAWDTGIEYVVRKAARGWLASFASGEGLVCEMRGRGRIWIQSRNPREYGMQIGRRLPAKTG